MADTHSYRRRSFDLKDGTMTAIETGPEDRPIDLVLLHANGFNGLTYRMLAEQLDARVLLPDLRGFGGNTQPTDHDSLATFEHFAHDVAELLKQLDQAPVVLAGHSLGATTSVFTHRLAPEQISRVVALEPVVLPFFMRWSARFRWGRRNIMNNFVLAKKAQRRREWFENKELIAERYRGRGAFKGVPEQILRDYIEDGFVPAEDGGVRLAADRMWEAATYAAQSGNVWPALRRLPEGSQIHLVTHKDGASTDLARRRIKTMKHLNVTVHKDKRHFFPLTHTDVAVAALKRALGAKD